MQTRYVVHHENLLIRPSVSMYLRLPTPCSLTPEVGSMNCCVCRWQLATFVSSSSPSLVSDSQLISETQKTRSVTQRYHLRTAVVRLASSRSGFGGEGLGNPNPNPNLTLNWWVVKGWGTPTLTLSWWVVKKVGVGFKRTDTVPSSRSGFGAPRSGRPLWPR